MFSSRCGARRPSLRRNVAHFGPGSCKSRTIESSTNCVAAAAGRSRNRIPRVRGSANLPADGLGPHETVWYGSFRSAVESSVAELPIVQREALDLTLFENRTNTEVAASLHVPLGTAKTRIRAGLRRLRGNLARLSRRLALAAVLASCAPAVAPRL